MEMLKKCLNPKVLIGLALVALGFLIFAPKLLVGILPLLIIAACPLSMVLMMGSMGNKSSASKDSDKLDILQRRLAKGEITEQQYDSMKSKLQDGRTGNRE